MAQRTSIVVALGFLATGCVIGSATIESGPSGSDPAAGGATGGNGTGGSAPTASGVPGGGTASGTGSGASGPYAWKAGDFGACSLPCGGGTRTRTVTCTDSRGVAAADGLCMGPRPAGGEACNAQSCSNIDCTPVIGSTAIIPISPATGPGPLTVTFDINAFSPVAWDAIDFGDGTKFSGFVFVAVPGPGGGGSFACVNHTFIGPGTYSVGRTLTGGDPQFFPFHEATVVVQ